MPTKRHADESGKPVTPPEGKNDPKTDETRLRVSASTRDGIREFGERLKVATDDDAVVFLLNAYEERFAPTVFSELPELEALLDWVAESAHGLAATNFLLAKMLIQHEDGKYAKLEEIGDELFRASEKLVATNNKLKKEHNNE